MSVLRTRRLVLGPLTADDASFLIELLNEPSVLHSIGDRGVRTEEDVERYLARGPHASYRQHGFGLYRVGLRESDEAIGICGLIRRPGLSDVDLGFAFLPRFWGRGYAFEAARRVVRHAREDHGLRRLVAITNPDNQGSIRVLERIGMRFEGMVRLTGDDPELKLYGCALDSAPRARASTR